MPETDIESAKVVAERIREAIERDPFIIPVAPGQIKCTSSLGISLMKDDDTPETLLHKADQCLYKAKEGGRSITDGFRHRQGSRPRLGQREVSPATWGQVWNAIIIWEGARSTSKG